MSPVPSPESSQEILGENSEEHFEEQKALYLETSTRTFLALGPKLPLTAPHMFFSSLQ